MKDLLIKTFFYVISIFWLIGSLNLFISGLELLSSIGEFDLKHRTSTLFLPSYDLREFGFKSDGSIQFTDWLTMLFCLTMGWSFTYYGIGFFRMMVLDHTFKNPDFDENSEN